MALCVVGICFLSGGPGCVSGTPEPGFWERVELDRVWPPPPEQARIGYLGEIHSGKDLGKAKSWLEKLGDRIMGETPMSMVKPLGVARNQNGLLVVTDPSFPTVHFFDLAQREYHWLEDDLSALLGAPVGVALDDLGNAYVTDSIRRKVFIFDAQRRLVGEIGEGVLERPTGIAFDAAQKQLYIVDTLACELFVFEPSGRLVKRFGSRGAGPGQLNAPTYVAVSPDGTIAITDTLNFRIQTFTPESPTIAAVDSTWWTADSTTCRSSIRRAGSCWPLDPLVAAPAASTCPSVSSWIQVVPSG
jgi:hypothetical protein